MEKKIFKICRLIIINFIVTLLCYCGFNRFPNKIIEVINVYKYEIILFIVLITIIFRLYSFLEDKFLNFLDCIVLDVSIFSLLILLHYFLFKYYYIILSCDFAYVGIRIVFLTAQSTFGENEKNTFTLSEIIENISKNKRLPSYFIFNEEPVNYDLLSRSFLINDLIKNINNVDFISRFNIGITGEWGYGKTTLINNCICKLDEEKYLIFRFNPWMYGSTSKILNGFFNQIPSEIFPHNIRNLNLIRSIVELITKHDYKIFDIVSVDNLRIYKKILSTNLNKSGKKLVVVVDNLDRLNSTALISLLGIIYNYFNVKNVVFILSYNKSAVNKILENNGIKKEYMEKIVQKEMDVSIMDYASLSNEYVITMSSLTEYYLSDILDPSKLEYLIGEVKKFALYLAEQQLSIRNFKRYLNSMILPYLQNDPRLLNVIDYYIISYIHMFHQNSYRNIYQLRGDLLNGEINSIINEFDKECHPLINYLFKNTDRDAESFSDAQDISIDEKVINDKNFFYNYFTVFKNSGSVILNRIEDIVNRFKKDNSDERWKKELKDVIKLAIDEKYIDKTFNYLTNYALILNEEKRSLFVSKVFTSYPFSKLNDKKLMSNMTSFLVQELFYLHEKEYMKTIINSLDKIMLERVSREVDSMLSISDSENIKILSMLLKEREKFYL